MNMTAIAMIAAAASLAGIGMGCMAPVKDVNVNTLGKDYYNQPNNTPILELSGKAMDIHLTGVDSMKVSTQLPTKNMIPRDPGVLDSIGNLFGSVAPWIAGAYIGGKLADRPATVQPSVVEKQVLVPVEGASAP